MGTEFLIHETTTVHTRYRTFNRASASASKCFKSSSVRETNTSQSEPTRQTAKERLKGHALPEQPKRPFIGFNAGIESVNVIAGK